MQNDSVAQLVEQMTLNHWVVGSSPTGVTIENQTVTIKSSCLFLFAVKL